MAAKLTEEQQAMLDSCLALGAAWTTSVGGQNEALLTEWSRQGWAKEIAPPAGLSSLRAFVLTDAGRQALSLKPEDGR